MATPRWAVTNSHEVSPQLIKKKSVRREDTWTRVFSRGKQSDLAGPPETLPTNLSLLFNLNEKSWFTRNLRPIEVLSNQILYVAATERIFPLGRFDKEEKWLWVAATKKTCPATYRSIIESDPFGLCDGKDVSRMSLRRKGRKLWLVPPCRRFLSSDFCRQIAAADGLLFYLRPSGIWPERTPKVAEKTLVWLG